MKKVIITILLLVTLSFAVDGLSSLCVGETDGFPFNFGVLMNNTGDYTTQVESVVTRIHMCRGIINRGPPPCTNGSIGCQFIPPNRWISFGLMETMVVQNLKGELTGQHSGFTLTFSHGENSEGITGITSEFQLICDNNNKTGKGSPILHINTLTSYSIVWETSAVCSENNNPVTSGYHHDLTSAHITSSHLTSGQVVGPNFGDNTDDSSNNNPSQYNKQQNIKVGLIVAIVAGSICVIYVLAGAGAFGIYYLTKKSPSKLSERSVDISTVPQASLLENQVVNDESNSSYNVIVNDNQEDIKVFKD